jgi:hypothetical protein
MGDEYTFSTCALAIPLIAAKTQNSNNDLLFINFKNKLFKKRGSIFGLEKVWHQS